MVYNKENLDKMTKIELKKLAKENDLTVNGRKDEIITRVLSKIHQNLN